MSFEKDIEIEALKTQVKVLVANRNAILSLLRKAREELRVFRSRPTVDKSVYDRLLELNHSVCSDYNHLMIKVHELQTQLDQSDRNITKGKDLHNELDKECEFFSNECVRLRKALERSNDDLQDLNKECTAISKELREASEKMQDYKLRAHTARHTVVTQFNYCPTCGNQLDTTLKCVQGCMKPWSDFLVNLL